MQIKHKISKEEQSAAQTLGYNKFIGEPVKDIREFDGYKPDISKELLHLIPDISYTKRFVVSNESKRLLANGVDSIGLNSVLSKTMRRIGSKVADTGEYLSETNLEMVKDFVTRSSAIDVADAYANVIVNALKNEGKYNSKSYAEREHVVK